MRSTLPTFDEVWQQQFRQRLIAQTQTLDQSSHDTSIVLACSGGMDSMLLLYLFADLTSDQLSHCQFKVITIDHQLQADSAKWSDLVAQHCEKLAIPCKLIQVDVAQGNLEAEARKARYHAFENELNENDVLILGHHQQDQAETLLMRLFQGAGVRGLSAMQAWQTRSIQSSNSSDIKNYFIWRPLLSLSKKQVQQLAKQWSGQLGFDYVIDPMNHDDDFDRVWYRTQILPLIEQRIPHAQDSLSRTAILMQDADQILQEVLAQDIQYCVDDEGCLNIRNLKTLSTPRQRQLLSAWMQGDENYRPPLAMVERLNAEVIDAREDTNSVLHWSSLYFMRYENVLYRYTAQKWQAIQEPIQPTEIKFSLHNDMTLAGQNFKINTVENGQDGLKLDVLNQILMLNPRQGGEKIRLNGRKDHRFLKKMLQEAKIAPWFRHQTQILMYHNVPLGVFTPLGFWLADSEFVEPNGWLPILERE